MQGSRENIRIGTLVNGNLSKPEEYIRQILPYGFESFGIIFSRSVDAVDLAALAEKVKEVLKGSNAIISHVGVFGNALESEDEDISTLRAWEKLIDNAHLFGCDMVGGFTGRVRGKYLHESIPRFKEVFTPLAQQAKDKGVRLAFENCSMWGTWQHGDWNIAHNPVAWELMFEAVPYDNLGLQWEPCHQMASLINPLEQLKQWVGRIFNVHGKDATIHWDVIRKYGIHSSIRIDHGLETNVKFAPAYVEHRTPGFGDSNWTDIITELRRAGYKGTIDIEGWHDPVYREDLEMTGQVAALNHLKMCRGGDYVANPA